MMRKRKFKPIITRVKLNPEQAVLQCDCYHGGLKPLTAGPFDPGHANPTVCDYHGAKALEATDQCTHAHHGSYSGQYLHAVPSGSPNS